jgi:hypothetical protein
LRNIIIIHKEALVMVYALHKFRHYMLCNKFVFYINCVTLVYLVKKTHVFGNN